MTKKYPTILLTGVNGFLGNYLTPVLLENGFIVYGIGRGICQLNIQHPRFFYGDVDITDYKK